MTTTVEGGCFCGAVRYRAARDPELCVYCFCSDCLKRMGSDGYAGFMVDEDTFEHLHGDTAYVAAEAASGRTVKRHFCPECGSHLWGETELGLVSIAAGTLDEPDLFQPTMAAFTENALTWARIPEGLEGR